jgi:hypothetical protein
MYFLKLIFAFVSIVNHHEKHIANNC